MDVKKVVELTQAQVVSVHFSENISVSTGFSSDLMSDVLTLEEDSVLLISGLANIQLIRTAEMADIHVVLLARNKKADEKMVELANETGITLLESPFSIFKCSGILFQNGLKPVY